MSKIVLAAVAAFSLMQDSGAAPLEPASKWIVEELPSGCRASRTFGAKGDISFAIVDSPLTGNDVVSVVMPDPITVAYGDPVHITLDPAGRELRGTAIGFLRGGKPTTLAVSVDAAAFSNVPVSAIRVSTNTESIAYLSISHLPELVAALKACEQRMLTDFGVDLAEQASVATLPKPRVDAGRFRPDDYPVAALRAGAQGMVAGRFRVKEDGSGTDCVVVVSSGSAALDKGTCELVLKRARYSPALSKDGRPVPSAQLFSMRWSIPK